MEWTEQEKKLIEKAEFYKSNEILSHVFVIPKPKFKNGLFVSRLEELNGKCYWWFIEKGSSVPIRLFLFEVYDIEDYKEREEK
jgi:hypothetical protein